MKTTEDKTQAVSQEYRNGYTQALRDIRQIVAKYRGSESDRETEDKLIVREIELKLGVFRIID